MRCCAQSLLWRPNPSCRTDHATPSRSSEADLVDTAFPIPDALKEFRSKPEIHRSVGPRESSDAADLKNHVVPVLGRSLPGEFDKRFVGIQTMDRATKFRPELTLRPCSIADNQPAVRLDEEASPAPMENAPEFRASGLHLRSSRKIPS